jgi:nicotinate-nucleotide--dimethylbenzimidazole phosphoribosyltransferase
VPVTVNVTGYAAAAAAIVAPDRAAAAAADERQGRLTKPPGALGALEALGTRLAAIAGKVPPPVPRSPVVAVFAGDHGVLSEGVSPWPAEVTAQMVANFLAGGAAVNVLASLVGAEVVVVDVGVATPLPGAGAGAGREGDAGGAGDGAGGGAGGRRLVLAKVRPGTGNIAVEPAMTRDEAVQALDAGADLAAELVGAGADCLVTGDMGIGNTTPSAALVAAFTGLPARQVTGRGTGIGDAEWETKVGVVERSLARAAAAGADPSDPVAVLAELGGLEIAGIAGLVIGGAAARVPVVLDGVIALAGALVAHAVVPMAIDYCVAGHRSTEPGASAALAHLGLDPLLDLGLRLGEGTGGCLAIPLVQAAARLLGEMATFDSAGVSER